MLIYLKLVQSTMANFHIDTDKIAIGRINESLSTLQQARDLRIREAENALKSRYFLLDPYRALNIDQSHRTVPQFCDFSTAAPRNCLCAKQHRSCFPDNRARYSEIPCCKSSLRSRNRRRKAGTGAGRSKEPTARLGGRRCGRRQLGEGEERCGKSYNVRIFEATGSIQLTANYCKYRLKLKVYRSLGIDVETGIAGNYNRAVIRNKCKGDVHVINIDPKFSRFFYSNYFWQTMH